LLASPSPRLVPDGQGKAADLKNRSALLFFFPRSVKRGPSKPVVVRIREKLTGLLMNWPELS
jgi:hypothetical protein